MMMLIFAASCTAKSSDDVRINQKSSGDESNGGNDANGITKIKITFGQNEIYADFEDNATSRALIDKMPFTIPMMNLYGREMCYRYGANALPTTKLRYDGYQIGDIAYWPPAGSLVILYKQNGEEFERQHIGHIDGNVSIFAGLGTTDITFSKIE